MATIVFGISVANCPGAMWTSKGALTHPDGKKMVVSLDDARRLVAEFPSLKGATPPGLGLPATYDVARVEMARLAAMVAA